MAPLRGMIPAVALLALLGVGALALLLETVLYLGWSRWYYRLGPALHREEWQTAATPDAVRSALEQAVTASELSARFRGDCVCARRK